MSQYDLLNNLYQLTVAFRTYVEHLQRNGTYWIPAGPTPRLSPAALIPGDQDIPSFSNDTDANDTDEALATINIDSSMSKPATSSIDQSGQGRGSCLNTETKAEQMSSLQQQLLSCQRCRLSATRTNAVFGTGNPDATLFIVGEAPGRDEDEQGEPFVGAAGQLLTKMIEAMGLRRADVYIANVIKCRPPQNRDPAPDEISACVTFLERQLNIVQPAIILAMGNCAAKVLLQTNAGITKLRGQFHKFHEILLMPTFHPAYLLRYPDNKRLAWNDLKMVMAEMARLESKK